MRLIKPAIIGIIGLTVIVTLISLLLPSEAHGRRGIVANAARDKIMQQINDFANWRHWQPDFANNASKISFGKTSAGIDGTCDLTKPDGKTDHYKFSVYTDSSVTVLQQRPGENDIQHLFTLSNDAGTNGIYIDWKMITHLNWYPWEKFSGFFTESFAAPGMERALDSLKSYTEHRSF